MPDRHTSKETAVLAALARGVLGDAYVPGVASRMSAAIDELAAVADRRKLRAALHALETRTGALAMTGHPTPVSWLARSEAESLLQKWRGTPMWRGFGAIVTALALRSLYAFPGPEWERIGYPGPLGPPPDGVPGVTPIEVTNDEHLTCDVVVVGSGAGGGCVAAGLAGAGFDVVVLEKGAHHGEEDFGHVEGEALRDLYLYGATFTTRDRSVLLLAGSALGGGTVVNYATSFRPPRRVLERWHEISGIDAFVSGELDQDLAEVSARLEVNTDSSAAGRRDAAIEEGLKRLGWHVDMMPRAVRGCIQDESCGYCGFGCRAGAKQSTPRTYLLDAAGAGARIVVGTDVDRVTIRDGVAAGVVALSGTHRVEVSARAVVVACGALETPALLLRSGLGGRVGHDLHLHPGTAAWGVFDDEVRMWEGTLQARYSNEFCGWDDGWGPIFETIPAHPGSWAAALPWTSASSHRELMSSYKNIGLCAVLPRDTSSGRVTIGRDGRPRVAYALGADDERRIALGVAQSGRVLEAAGALRIASLQSDLPAYVPSHPGSHDRWAEQITRARFGRRRATLVSYHQMGSCRMGNDAATSAISADNEAHEVRNLFVADGSAFPSASGVNPMLTIYAIANRAARRIAARLA